MKPRQTGTRYLAALALLALAFSVRLSLAPWLGNDLAHSTILVAVLLSAWYCGPGPAAAVAVLGYAATQLLIAHGLPSVTYLAGSATLYGALVVVIILFVAGFRRERDKLSDTQARLRRSEQRLRAGFDNAALGIVEADRDDRFTAVNERMCRVLGYDSEGLLGKTILDITVPAEHARTRELLDGLHSGRLERIDYEKRLLRRDGSSFWVHVTASALRDDAGRFAYSIGTFEDINERKIAEERVLLLTHAIESAANSILLTDRGGRILWANSALTRLTGYGSAEVLNQSPSMFKSGLQPAGFYRDLWQTILKGSAWHGELVNRRKDGSLYHEEMTVTPVRGSGEEITHFVAVKEDISERKRTEESLRTATAHAERARAAAEEATRAKDRFLAVLSHELRTPLTPLLTAVQVMQRRTDLAPGMDASLDMMRRNVELEARLIDDLLDLTRIAQGKLVLERKPMALFSTVQAALDIARPEIEERSLRFSVQLEAGVIVNGDASRLQQVVWNLVSNAVKFTADGGLICVACRQMQDRAVIEVSDTGIGIEPENLGRIFDAFEQADPAVTRQFGGLGLGLAIAKRLVEAHEGTISAHSAGKNQGAVFRVSLPLGSEPPSDQPERRGRPAPAPSCRILLVEDNGDTAAVMKLLLESSGYEVELAGDVSQALATLQADGFDLLISDLGLPDRSGLDLMQDLRRRGSAIRGIALSGYGREEDLRRSDEAGFSAHLTKPVDADTLLTVIARTLRDRVG